MPCVLETGVRELQKYEKRKQTSLGNTVNDMCLEILKVWKSSRK